MPVTLQIRFKITVSRSKYWQHCKILGIKKKSNLLVNVCAYFKFSSKLLPSSKLAAQE
jgi:hypothetical protein